LNSSKTLLAAIAVLAIGAFGATSALSQDKEAQVKTRQDTMKRMSADMKVIKTYGEGAGEEAKAVAAATDIVETLKKLPDLFPKGTGMAEFPGKSGAKPAIWTEWDKFLAEQKNVVGQAELLLAAVKRGDKAVAASGPTSLWDNGCQGCHKPFREKLS
jgi:cytochrome c556